MKKTEFTVTKQNNVDVVRYELKAADAYDERVADKISQANGIVTFQYSDDEGVRSITSYVKDGNSLESMLKKTLDKKSVLAIISGIAGAFEVGALGVPVSYIIKDTNYIYVNEENYTVKCLLLPIKQDVMPMAELPMLFREILSKLRYDEKDKDNYVAKLITLVNSDDFSVSKLKDLADKELEQIGYFVSKDSGLTDMNAGKAPMNNNSVKVNKLGVMNNMMGQPGPQGMPGQPPMMGQPGPMGMPGQPPMMGQPGPQGMMGGRPPMPGTPQAMMGQPRPQGMPGQPPMMGQPGPQGMPGQPPMMGQPGPQGMPGQPPMMGQPRPQGVPGQPPMMGQPGPQGMPGQPPMMGQPRPQGMPGQPPMMGQPRPQGMPGQPPMMGQPGPQGMPGQPPMMGQPRPQGMPGQPPMMGQPGPQGMPSQPPKPAAPAPQGIPMPGMMPGTPAPAPVKATEPIVEEKKEEEEASPFEEIKPEEPKVEEPKAEEVKVEEAKPEEPKPVPVAPTPVAPVAPTPVAPTPAAPTPVAPTTVMPTAMKPAPAMPTMPNSAPVPNPAPTEFTMGSITGQLGSKPVPHIVRKNTGEAINITKPEFAIGKSKTKADYVIENNSAISRVHCIIVQKDGVNYIKDNNSTNHTYVNGVELEPGKEVLLKNKTVIQLGDEEFTFLLRKGE